MPRLNGLEAIKTPGSIENSFNTVYQKSLEAKISPILGIGEIRFVCDLSRLCFILALATLYVTAQGIAVVEGGRRRWVDTHWFRGNSYFRIGLDWVQSALLDGWQLIRQVLFTSDRAPDPAMAPRIQHEKRSFRLEFQSFTVQFKPD